MTTETSSVSTVEAFNTEIEKLKSERNNEVRAAFKEIAKNAFRDDPELQNFAFGINGNEYNDEGLYEGINFVARNLEIDEDGDDYDSGVTGQYWSKHDWRGNFDDKILSELERIGDEALVDTFGTYDIVLVTRAGDVTIHEAGY